MTPKKEQGQRMLTMILGWDVTTATITGDPLQVSVNPQKTPVLYYLEFPNFGPNGTRVSRPMWTIVKVGINETFPMDPEWRFLGVTAPVAWFALPLRKEKDNG